MTTAVQTPVQSEYRNLPLESLTESPLNPRRTFDDAALQELAESIRTQGVLSPLLVRPKGPQTYEIVAGARRYRAAQLAAIGYVPVRIADLSDAQALEMSIVENLQRRDVHPLEEAQGFAALLRLEEPAYSIEQIAAKCGKQPGYVASRIRLTELAPAVVEAFAKDEIGVGHALLLAKLQPEQQEEALAACWQESYGNGSKSKRILLPVRHLREWIEHNILLELAAAPFSKDDPQLVPEAGSCVDCPKRTGHNTLLFEGVGTKHDSCSDPKCYAVKLEVHVRQTVAAKPKLVQISTAYGQPKDGSAAIPAQQVRRSPAGQAAEERAARLAGIQDVQVYRRGHRHRGQRERRTAPGVRQSRMPGPSSEEEATTDTGRCLPSRPNRRSAAARRRWPRRPGCAS
jgi:ParB family chromosome partitioning protein